MKFLSIFGGIAILVMTTTNFVLMSEVGKVKNSVESISKEISNKKLEVKDSVEEDNSLPANKDSLEFFTERPNDTAVYKALVFFDIPNPKVVLAQAKLETGHYRKVPSGNLFGLRQRNGSYMRFSHWTESILSYKKYISSKYRGEENTEAYLAFLTRLGYAESPNYNRVLRVIVKNVEQLEFVD